MKTLLVLTMLALGLPVLATPNFDNCTVCGGRIERVVYFFDDKVTGEKKAVCETCSALPTACYLCGMPVKSNFEELQDGRILCARDVKNVVLDEGEAQRIWQDVKNTVERQFSRFMTFPDNVTVHPLDRVDLQDMFQVVGHDFTCPNVWGCTLRETNDDNRISFKISLLRGLPPSGLKATCAHELTHTWISENVSRERKRRMSQDSVEGFCELVAWLYVEAQGDKAQLGVIKSNTYTRGQAALFREAERRFGMNDVIDWMQYGVDTRLNGSDLTRVRKIETPPGSKRKPPAALAIPFVGTVAPPAPPETLMLKGIMWSARPSAVINDRTFMVNDESKVPLGSSNVVVRCLAIRRNAVDIQIGGSDKKQTLILDTGNTR